MSNENSATNRPPKRYRTFALITYLSELHLKMVLLQHDNQIRAYAYILHDKDLTEQGTPKEVHIHLLIKTVNTCTVEAVKKWFKGFTDEKGLPINTLAQPMHDITSSFDYLTHDTEQSRAEGKYQYPKTDIVSNDIEFWESNEKQDQDNITLAIIDLMNGLPLSLVAIKYGRDFIIHYQSIKLLLNDINQENGVENKC